MWSQRILLFFKTIPNSILSSHNHNDRVRLTYYLIKEKILGSEAFDDILQTI